MTRDDARMTALCMVGNAKKQELPGYPITRRIEGGTVGSELVRYDWRNDRLVVAGHEFSVRELLGCLDRLRQMVDEVPQGELFAEAA